VPRRRIKARGHAPPFALALIVRHEAGIKTIAAALITKRALTGGEAHQLFARAGWPAAALYGEAKKRLALRD
jgi:hypothetical protein